MKIKWFFLLAFSSLLFSCGEFNTVLKSTDYEYKYKKGIEYYEAGDYNHAITLFEDLVYAFRGTSKGDDLYYYYASSCFKAGDYTLAGYYYKSIYEQYPRSEFAEEAQFMVGMCFYKDSPNPRLDQEISQKAIDAFQLFINLYPYSNKVEEANMLIDELNEKVVYKSYLSAKLYYDMEYYKSAVIALNNSLNDYPSTKYREELKFLLFKSKYLLAVNSVEEKKRERTIDARDEYFTFADEFPQSKYLKEVNRDYKHIQQLLGLKEDETSMVGKNQ
ncbi:MAG TPA: outer membrane protein assembly factor BamD [Prolixibacteraceae bacterium]|nr:outer membrane protein assembly factor BamD [Prolixibacteraceae bacterium]